MSKVVGEIAINVTADVGPLMRDIGRGSTALKGMERVTAEVASGMQRFGAATADLGKKMSIISAGIAAVSAATLTFVNSSAVAGAAIEDAAKAAGMSTTAFQEYRFALKDAAAMTDEDFAGAAAKLNKTLGEARGGSEAAIKAFEAIGVSQAQLAEEGFSTDQAMAAFIARMEGMKDPALAAAVATDLFGKAGAEMGAMLSGVPGQVQALVDHARELGVVLGPETVAAAGQFDQKMEEMGTQVEAVKMKLADVLLPVLVNQLIPVLQEKVIPAIGAVVEKIGEWIAWFGDLDPAIQQVTGLFVGAFAVGGPVLLAVGAVSSAIGALVAATGPVGLFIAAAGLLYAAWQKWGDDIKGAIGSAIDWIAEKFDAIMGKVRAFIDTIAGVPAAIAEAFKGFSLARGEDGGLAENFDFGGEGGAEAPSGGGAEVLYGTGRNVMLGLSEGMGAGAAEVMPQIEAYLQAVTAKAEEVFGVQSPSTGFAAIGGFIGQGLAQGIAESQALVGQAVSVMGRTAVSSADGTVSDILSSLGTLFQGSKRFAAAQALINAWTGASEALKLPFPASLAAFGKVLATGMSAVKNIQSASPGSAGGSGGAASAGSAAAPAPAPMTSLNFTVQNDPFGYGEAFARSLVEQLNAATRNGSTIVASVTPS